MAPEPGNEIGNFRNFEEFFKKWKDEQKHELDDLITASNNSEPSSLPGLLGRVIAHYEKYYSTKTEWAKTDVFQLLSPPWNTQLEDSYLWIGGWRPSTAFHLLYSKSSLQFEASLPDLLKGMDGIGDLGDLSHEQMGLIDTLHGSIIKKEREIAEKLAKLHGKAADMEMVALSHKTREEGESGRVDSALKSKEKDLVMILKRADDLRLETFKGIVGTLTPNQAVHLFIAAGELLRRMHEWGKEKEAREGGKRAIL